MPAVAQAAVLAVGLGVLTVISIVNRRRRGWRWRGAGARQLLGALLSVASVGVMLFVIWPMIGPSFEHITAWLGLLALIALFNTLAMLGIVRQSQDAFEADCRGDEPQTAVVQPDLISDAPGADWRVWVQRIWYGLFILVWLSGMAFFYFQTRAHSVADITPVIGGSPLGLLTAFWMGGTFFVLISGFLLHFVFRIRVLPNMPLPGEPRR